MKKAFTLLAFAAVITWLVPVNSFAQKLRANIYSSYIFQDKVDSYYDPETYFQGQINGGYQWGVGLEYMINPSYGLELSYKGMNTKAPLKNYQYPVNYHDYDLNISYIFLSGTRYVRKPGSKVEGFGGLGLGVGIFNAKDPNPASDVTTTSGNLTKFSWQLHLGAIIWASEKVGIKLQGSLQSATQAIGGGVYFGTGGAGAGVSSYSSIYQFGLGGGLVFPFGGEKSTAKSGM